MNGKLSQVENLNLISQAGFVQKISFIKNYCNSHLYLTSFILGLLGVTLYPPVDFFVIGWLVFPAMLLLSDNIKSKRTSFYFGWWFGFGNFIAGTYWISISMLVEAEKFAWMMPFCIFGVSGFLALFPAFVFLCLYISKTKLHAKILSFALLWLIFEYIRGHIFTGFPWNLLAHSWSQILSILQITNIIGVYGLSLLSALIFAWPYAFFKDNNTKTKWLGLLLPLILLAALFAYGQLRLLNKAAEYVPNVKVRIVQASVPLSGEKSFSEREKILYKYLGMSSMDNNSITHVIWPESAMQFFVQDKSEILQIIRHALPKDGTLISGYDRVNISPYGQLEKVWNSLLAMNDEGQILASYDKQHLVPFGEYVPLRKYLPVEKIVPGEMDISSGTKITTISLKGFPKFSPLICYEAIFPGQVANKEDYPQLLVNLTNDAWFGNSSGPYQHLANIRIRSIEEGLPLIRAANTGISAFIDPYGRIIASTKLNAVVNLDHLVPKPLPSRSFYSLYGDWSVLVLGIICLLIIMLLKFKRPI